jgi:Ca2+-binding RTX toxin-like protein
MALITGTTGNDQLIGNGDELDGGEGDDTLTGSLGSSSDTIILHGNVTDYTFTIGSSIYNRGKVFVQDLVGNDGRDTLEFIDRVYFDKIGASFTIFELANSAPNSGAGSYHLVEDDGITDPNINTVYGLGDLGISDPENDAWIFTSVTLDNPLAGFITQLAGYPGPQLLFNAVPNFWGQVTLNYTATDEYGKSSSGSTIITIAPTNDWPWAADDSGPGLVLNGLQPTIIDPAFLLANDSDVESDALTIAEIYDSVGCTATLDASGNIVVTADPTSATGQPYFTYVVSDPFGGFGFARVYLTFANNPVFLTPGNDSFDANNTNIIYALGGADTITSTGVNQIHGGAGYDTWIGQYSSSTSGLSFYWDGAGSGNLSNGTNLKSFENVTLNTGSGVDDIQIDGGGELTFNDSTLGDNDSFAVDMGLEQGSVVVDVFADVGRPIAGSVQTDQLAKNIQFTNYENIYVTTGNGADTFALNGSASVNGVSVAYNAGGGSDVLNLSLGNLTTATSFVVSTTGVTSNRGFFFNFETFNVVTGSGADTLVLGADNDTIFAGEGADTMTGGSGNDTLDGWLGTDTASFSGNRNDYNITILDNGSVQVLDAEMGQNDGQDDGTDTLLNIENFKFADGTRSLSNLFSLGGTNNGVLIIGTAGADVISPTRTVAGQVKATIYQDFIYGVEGNDNLNGGLGADLMYGGVGNDIFAVDNLGDRTTELQNEGLDRVNATVSWTLLENTENLVLQGTAAINGTGNASNNALTGNAASNDLIGLAGLDTLKGAAGIDRLIGGEGKDTLTGGADQDTFVFGKAITANADRVTDFARNIDILEFTGKVFGIAAGPLDATLLQNNTVAKLGHAQFLFNAKTHVLSWDADGIAGGSVAIATLVGVNALSVDDFSIV